MSRGELELRNLQTKSERGTQQRNSYSLWDIQQNAQASDYLPHG